jgi:hypothetical protein
MTASAKESEVVGASSRATVPHPQSAVRETKSKGVPTPWLTHPFGQVDHECGIRPLKTSRMSERFLPLVELTAQRFDDEVRRLGTRKVLLTCDEVRISDGKPTP